MGVDEEIKELVFVISSSACCFHCHTVSKWTFQLTGFARY